MEKTTKVTLKFNCSKQDIQLFKAYKTVIEDIKQEFGNKITVLTGVIKQVYHRNEATNQWEKINMYDIIILCESHTKEKILQKILK